MQLGQSLEDDIHPQDTAYKHEAGLRLSRRCDIHFLRPSGLEFSMQHSKVLTGHIQAWKTP